jgi:regulator of nucleoside diphosphate kinase
MKYGELIIDKKEHDLLLRSISESQITGDKVFKESVAKLSTELKSAKIVDDKNIPEDIIRFNSIVTICTAFNVEKRYQIVTPEKSDILQNKISILSPMALALFGYAQDDEIVWQFPSGMSTIKIVKVLQNESKVEI